MKHGKLNPIIALLALVAGIVLILSGLWIPPAGVIEPSVLVAYGETLTFVGGILGVDIHYRNKYNNKDNNLISNDKLNS